MKKTCFNCKFFCNTLCDPENPVYHVHYWCKRWKAFIPSDSLSGQYEYSSPYWDDLETGEAVCYLFQERETPMHKDSWFDRNREENIRSRMEESL